MRASRQTRFNPPRLDLDGRGRVLLAGVAATVLLVLAAVASRPVAPPTGVAAANPGPALALLHLIEILGLALELLAVLVLVVIVRPRWRRRKDDEPPEYHEPYRAPWWLKLLAVALPLLVIAGIVYAIVHMASGAPPPQPIEFAPPPPATSGNGAGIGSALSLGWWEYAIAAALAGIVFAFILRAARRPAPTGRLEPETASQRVRILTAAVGAGLMDARRERDPRRAVIAAYATMERTLADHGLPRSESEAPLEYMSRLFAELGVGQDAIRTLTHLFEVARFSHHQIQPAAKAQAILALVDLQEELRASP